MWNDYWFSQRNKTTERAVELGVGGDREGGQTISETKFGRSWTKFEKGGRQYREFFVKQGGWDSSTNYVDITQGSEYAYESQQ